MSVRTCESCKWWDEDSRVWRKWENPRRGEENSGRYVEDMHICRRMPTSEEKRAAEWCGEWKERDA